MTDDEHLLAALLAKRGYIVADMRPGTYRPGELIADTPWMYFRPTRTAQKFFVIGKTTLADAEEQLAESRKLGAEVPPEGIEVSWPHNNFYRLGTD